MNPDNPDRHADAQLLLPWFANGSLDAGQRAAVQAHLQDCADCRRTLDEERRIAAAVRASSLPARSPEPGLAKLLAALPAPTPAAAVTAPARRRSWWPRWPTWNAMRPWPIAMAAAGAFAVVATVGTLTFRVQSPDETYHVLSAAPASQPADRNEVHLVLAPSVDAARRDAILAIVDGRIVGGPNSVGAYTVRIATSGGAIDLTGALDRLRHEPDVLLAEAVTPLSMPHVGPDAP
jgi:hypothetical protein